jgi:hypothetical protein
MVEASRLPITASSASAPCASTASLRELCKMMCPNPYRQSTDTPQGRAGFHDPKLIFRNIPDQNGPTGGKLRSYLIRSIYLKKKMLFQRYVRLLLRIIQCKFPRTVGAGNLHERRVAWLAVVAPNKHGQDILYLFGELSRLANCLPTQLTAMNTRDTGHEVYLWIRLTGGFLSLFKQLTDESTSFPTDVNKVDCTSPSVIGSKSIIRIGTARTTGSRTLDCFTGTVMIRCTVSMTRAIRLRSCMIGNGHVQFCSGRGAGQSAS